MIVKRWRLSEKIGEQWAKFEVLISVSTRRRCLTLRVEKKHHRGLKRSLSNSRSTAIKLFVKIGVLNLEDNRIVDILPRTSVTNIGVAMGVEIDNGFYCHGFLLFVPAFLRYKSFHKA